MFCWKAAVVIIGWLLYLWFYIACLSMPLRLQLNCKSYDRLFIAGINEKLALSTFNLYVLHFVPG